MLLADCQYELGNVKRLQGLTDEAIIHLNKSRDLDLIFNDLPGIASSNVLLGIIYKSKSQYDEAIKYYQAAYDIFKESGSVNNMATCILNIANVYTRQEDYDEALQKYNEALDLGENLDEKENLYAFVYGNMSNLFSLQGELEKSLDFARKSHALRKSVARPEEQATSLIGIASSLNQLDRFKEAILALDTAKMVVEGTSGSVELKERIYEVEYKIYQKARQPEKALDAVAKYLVYYDSLRKTELDKQALDLNTKYESEKKEQEIKLLNAQNQATEIKLKATRRQSYILLGGLLILSIFGFLLYHLYRKTRQQNSVIGKALNEKDILLREIHHRVKNNLQFISSLLGLQSEHVSDLTALSALQEGQDRVQSMALIHQNLYQEDNLTGVEIKNYFVKLVRNLFDSYNIRPDQITLNLEVESLNLDVDTVIPIGLIVNELVSNSLKYAFAGKVRGTITVILKEEHDTLYLAVNDNGKGISLEEKKILGNSFGYRLIKVFRDQLQATLDIKNSNGTQVIMSIRKYRKVS